MLIHESNHPTYIANRELEWMGTDSKKNYESNLNNPKQRKQLELFGWIDKIITYKFNSQRFRSKEFTTSNSIVFLGGSDILGTGLPEEATIANIISTELNLECYNLGIGGGSNDCSYRIGRHWIPIIKPKIVFFIASPKARYEIKIKNKFENMLPNSNDGHFDSWAEEVDNCILNKEKNHFAMAHICASLNIKLVYFDDMNNFDPVDKARDLLHYGVSSNLQLAKKILSKV